MSVAVVFPGQGSQFVGMGKELYEKSSLAKEMFAKAEVILGFDISKIMFEGTEEELKQTKITQPAIFIHSVVTAFTSDNFKPAMVAGHSLGEFSALVAAQTLTFEDGLRLVLQRALAMQQACEETQGTMAAVIGFDDEQVVSICNQIEGEVIAANFNCPGQVVISGEQQAVEKAMQALTDAGARRVVPLPVSGAFHSNLMNSAKQKLADAIEQTQFSTPICPVYQNVDAQPTTDVDIIKGKLLQQLTSPVLWTQTVEKMLEDGATSFVESGPGKVLQGLVKKVNRKIPTSNLE